MALKQHYILTLDPRASEVFRWIQQHPESIRLEVHLNRTRFWLADDSALYTEFVLRFADCCPLVPEVSDDHNLGGFHD